jgi:ATPase subunit of ABC transporter with duplicated ATPase domains
MIHTSDLSLSFGGQVLFEDVSVKFLMGNCYGLIGANGSGKSTFLKILSGEIEASKGDVVIGKDKRIAVLKQDQFAFDEVIILETVLMGHEKLYKLYTERNELYAKTEYTEEEGMRIGELETDFAEMDGYAAESDAATILSELGINEELQGKKMKELDPGLKIRVLLAQALFGEPDILLLDEPTNQLDYLSALWLENYLQDFKNIVIVVSHDRHFLNKVCTHIANLDFKQINILPGNYDFWQESSQLAMKQKQDHNKRADAKVKELEEFVRRFSANASKSKQATSRKKLIEKIRPEELPVSSRRSPYINFKPSRACGNSIVTVKNVSHKIGDDQVLQNVSFTLAKHDKVAIVGQNNISKTILLQILAGEIEPDQGKIHWGESITRAYFPKDNAKYFDKNISLMAWLSQFTESSDIQFIRGFLGRMLFSADAVDKKVKVLSGGEKARAMFSKMMLVEANTLIFEDPTDHLDLESIAALNEGLEKYSECMFFSSHDFQLLNTVSNRIIEVSPKGMLDRKTSFDEFMQSEQIKKFREELY